jgi:hypothetical protein
LGNEHARNAISLVSANYLASIIKMLIISKLRVGIILCILLTQICSIALPSSAQTVCGLTTQEAAYTECLIGYSDFQDNINANLVVQDMLTKVKAPALDLVML